MKKKSIIVEITPYKSKFYPVQCRYTKNRIRYHEVFESVQQCKTELSFRFYDGILCNLQFIVKGFDIA